MGSSSSLSIGKTGIGEWKSYVPLEAMLPFSQEDYREVPSKWDGDDEKEYVTRSFVVSAGVAIERSNKRGLTIEVCRRYYDEFYRVEYQDPPSNDNSKNWVRLDYSDFLAACREVYEKEAHAYLLDSQEGISNRTKAAFDFELFSEDTWLYYGEMHFCVQMRSFLEVVPHDCEIVLDITQLVYGGYIDEGDVPHLWNKFVERMLQRIGLNYQLYGFVIEDDPSVNRRLHARIKELSEDHFIFHVLVPLLGKMGYERVSPVDSHGRNEFGSDIRPFRYTTPLGTIEFYALQAKAVAIHGTSSKAGNAGELVSQANAAFGVPFIDGIDNEQKRIDKFIIATNKAITVEARHVIESSFQGERRVVLLDIDHIVQLVKKHHLAQYILFTPLE